METTIGPSTLNPVQPAEVLWTPENRWQWLAAGRMLAVEDDYAQPRRNIRYTEGAVYAMTAQFRPGAEWRRTAENLVPTMLVYESDDIGLQAYWDNLVPEELKEHVYSVTWSGGKSLHALVPLSEADGRRIRGNKDSRTAQYKAAWEDVAGRLVRHPDVLDRGVVSIGRLTRFPGILRPDTGMPQVCCFFNPKARPYDLSAVLARAEADFAFGAVRHGGAAAKAAAWRTREGAPAGRDGALQDLARWNAARPSGAKSTALMVLGSAGPEDLPSTPLLAPGQDYMAGLRLLQGKYPQLLPEYVRRVKEAHPTFLPKSEEEYLE